MGDYLAQKNKAYEIFDKIYDSSDDEADPGFQASKEAMRKAKEKAKPAPLLKEDQRTLLRSVSDSTLALPLSSELTTVPSSTNPRNEVVSKPNLPTGLRKTVSAITAPMLSRAESAKVTGKRKRESGVKTVSEERQVFKNLHFYFFPNNDAAPARKMRITKAREFGATWHKEWVSDITHVVLDKNITYKQLLAWLKLEKLPENVAVVTEAYPAECLSYGTILDPTQARFVVKGFSPPSMSKKDSGGSDKSLQLVGKSSTARPAETPPPATEFIETTGPLPRKAALPDQTGDVTRIPDSFQAAEIDSSKELDEAIEKARALGDVSLDDDEDEDKRPASSQGADSGDDEQRLGLKLEAKRKTKNSRPSDKFQCMNKNTGAKSDNPNNATIDILQQMADYYGQTGDEWRIRAYRKAMSVLRNHPVKVTTKEEAGALPNIGPRLAEKIEEIAFTSRLRRLENAKDERTDQVLRTFMGVYGAGIKQASDWVSRGYKTLDELLDKAPLTENQRIGIEHYEDFNSRIPRAEVQQHGDFIRKALHKLDPSFEVIIGGSYRRGSEDSGDIDCIVTRPDTGAAHLRNVILGQLVPSLTAQGFLVANLAITSKDNGSKWHGASCLPSSQTWRRLDLLLVPSDEIGAALIYFTGQYLRSRYLVVMVSRKLTVFDRQRHLQS